MGETIYNYHMKYIKEKILRITDKTSKRVVIYCSLLYLSILSIVIVKFIRN